MEPDKGIVNDENWASRILDTRPIYRAISARYGSPLPRTFHCRRTLGIERGPLGSMVIYPTIIASMLLMYICKGRRTGWSDCSSDHSKRPCHAIEQLNSPKRRGERDQNKGEGREHASLYATRETLQRRAPVTVSSVMCLQSSVVFSPTQSQTLFCAILGVIPFVTRSMNMLFCYTSSCLYICA